MRVRERDLCTRSLKDNGRAAATPQRDELEAGPGRGPCPPRDVSRAAWGGGRMIKPSRSARPVTDRGQLCISARSRTRTTRPHQRDLATAASTHRPPPWPQRDRRAQRALLFQLVGTINVGAAPSSAEQSQETARRLDRRRPDRIRLVPPPNEKRWLDALP